MDYGTGAIFGCPAHDQRDYDFAKKYNLEIIPVLVEKDKITSDKNLPYFGDGMHINSDFLNGLYIENAIEASINKITKCNSSKKIIIFLILV